MSRRVFCVAAVVALSTAVCASTGVAATAPTTAPTTPATPSAAARCLPPTYAGLDAYRHFDKLSYLNLRDRTASQSTADLNGQNVDNTHVLRVNPDGSRTLFDQTGPLTVNILRHQAGTGDPWTATIDGVDRPPVRNADLGTADPRFPYPLSLNTSQTPASAIVQTAIGAQQGMSWRSASSNGNFYGLYTKHPFGTPVPSWTGTASSADVSAELNRAGTDISPPGAVGKTSTTTLPPSTETTVATLTGGPSQVRALQVRTPAGQQNRVGDARLRIYWDGSTSAGVDVPLKFLAGDGAGVYQPAGRDLVHGYPAGIRANGAATEFNVYWPMPFHTSARITITQGTSLPLAPITVTTKTEPFPEPACWWGTFHATYKNNPATPGRDMTFLDVAGSGKIVGTVLNFGQVGSTLEGNPRFYLDGSNSPQVEATGTEEWGLGGNYWRNGVQTTLPLGGLPSTLNGAAEYRFLIADSIPFGASALVRWEHGARNTGTLAYQSAVLWYANPAPTAVLTDTFHVADRTHGYANAGAFAYTVAGGYPYLPQTVASTDTGMKTTTKTGSTFTLALDPANVGAFLRRKLSYAVPDQRAAITVDGQPAGVWYSAGQAPGADPAGVVRRWREEEFPLPAALTAGKSRITVAVQPMSSIWTEFTYSAYSYRAAP